MRKVLALLLCALLSLMPCMALADGAPDALDMTRPLDSAAYQFDFAPWYSSMNDVLAAFGENTVWHRTSAGSLVSPNAGDMTIMECDYTSAITGADARLQLIFEAFADGDSTAELLVGVRMIEELSDLDALKAYISDVAARFDDMAERKVLDMTAKPGCRQFASLERQLRVRSRIGGQVLYEQRRQFHRSRWRRAYRRYADMAERAQECRRIHERRRALLRDIRICAQASRSVIHANARRA